MQRGYKSYRALHAYLPDRRSEVLTRVVDHLEYGEHARLEFGVVRQNRTELRLHHGRPHATIGHATSQHNLELIGRT